MKNRKTIKTLTKLVLFIFLVLLIVGSIIFYFAFCDDNKHIEYKDSSGDLVKKVVYSALFEKEVFIKSDEINGFISKQISQQSIKGSIKAINVKIDEKSSLINIYIRFKSQGFCLGFTFDTQVSLDKMGKIEFDIVRAKIGRLPISRKFAASIIKKVMKDYVQVKDTKIFTSSTFLINEFNTEIKITIDKILVNQDNFILKLSGGTNTLKNFLKDSFSKVFSLPGVIN